MPFLHDSLTLGDRSRVRCFKRRNVFKNFVFLCFPVKQKFYGHLLATKIFNLATEKKFQLPLDAHIKKLISDPDLFNSNFFPTVEPVHRLHPSLPSKQGSGSSCHSLSTPVMLSFAKHFERGAVVEQRENPHCFLAVQCIHGSKG